MKKMIFIFAIAGFLLGSPIEIGIGARAQAMGGAFVGVADDATAVYWNPAGLGTIQNTEIYFMHWIMPQIKELVIDYASVVYPLLLMNESNFGVGFGWKRVGAKLEEFSNGDLTQNPNLSTISENTFSLAAGAEVKKFSLGFVLNRFLIDSRIGSLSGWGFDFGFKAHLFSVLKIGFLMRNIAAGYGDEKIVPNYRFGFSLNFFPIKVENKVRDRVILAFDVSTKKNVNGLEGTTLHTFAGLEIQWIRQFAIRVGWNDNYPFSAGAGFYFKGILLDYAYSSGNKYLKDSHRLGFGLRF